MSISLKWIEWGSDDYELMVQLRDEVLRRPLGLVLDRSKLEQERGYGLLTAWLDKRIAGCMTLSDDGNGVARMRAVAVHPDLQGSGVGRLLAEEFERKALELGFHESFAHARKVAIPFYMRLGYQLDGEEFDEVTIPHQKVRKVLKNS